MSPVPESAPYDADAERAVLGGILLEPRTLERVQPVLEPDDFYLERHRGLYGAFLALEREGAPIDLMTVTARLGDNLERLGGFSGLAALPEAIPSTANIAHYATRVREAADKRRLWTLAHRLLDGATDRATPPGALLDQVETEVRALRERPGLANPVRNRMLRGAWREVPPARSYLLSLPEANGRPERGLLPLSRVGVLAGEGGVGKSTLLTLLAAAVTTGTPWCGLPVASPGPVLLVMAEEDGQEVWRRLHHTLHALRLPEDQVATVEANLVVLPLAGELCALTQEGGNDTLVTSFCRNLVAAAREMGAEAGGFRLVVLDPLSRFAGPDVEADNAAATRLIQVVERLTALPGPTPGVGPTVLLSHHTTKASRLEGTTAATAVRGASGLVDGARWVATVTAVRGEETATPFLGFAVVKNNYGPTTDFLVLRRDENHEGMPRAATREEMRTCLDALGEDAGKTPAWFRRAAGWAAPQKGSAPHPSLQGIAQKNAR